jgi:hypothetical protein
VSFKNAIRVSRENHKVKNRRGVRKAIWKYLNKWRLLAENPLTFPIAVLLYPATVLTGTITIIANGIGKKRLKMMK